MLNGLPGIGRVVDGADEGEGGELVAAQFGEVFGLNAADNDGRTGNTSGDVRGGGYADDGVGVGFALGGKEGADADVVGTGLVGFLCLFKSMGGDADDAVILLASAWEREVVLSEM